jgi:hypothetical protein
MIRKKLPIFLKNSPKSCQVENKTKKLKHLQQARFESPKHLQQTTFETLKYLQQTMF